jgi:hypothetical protein
MSRQNVDASKLRESPEVGVPRDQADAMIETTLRDESVGQRSPESRGDQLRPK